MWGVITWGLVIYFVANAIGSTFETMKGVGEAIVYESSCLGGKTKDVFKCTKEDGRIYVTKRRFKVDFDHQRVVEAGDIFQFKNDCLVYDSENWNCSSKDMSWFANMTDGRFQDSFYYDSKTGIMAKDDVPVTVYWYYYWKGFSG